MRHRVLPVQRYGCGHRGRLTAVKEAMEVLPIAGKSAPKGSIEPVVKPSSMRVQINQTSWSLKMDSWSCMYATA
jgi:hypothetical protein